MDAPLIISHAACKGHAPENTLAGVRAALDRRVDAIEIDIHGSSERIPVLIHDATLDRTTSGAGPVRDQPWSALRVLDAGRGERIPSLEQVLDLTRGHCLLVIEIKQRDLAPEVATAVRVARAERDTMIWSFHASTVAAARAALPATPAALLVAPGTTFDEAADQALRANAQALSLHHTLVTAETQRRARLLGLRVYTWTPDEPVEQVRVARAGVDGIVTNLPDVLATTLAVLTPDTATHVGGGSGSEAVLQ